MGSLLDTVEAPQFSDHSMGDFPEDFPEDFELDPPSESVRPEPAGKRLGSRLKPTGPTVPPAMRRRIKAEVTLYLEMVAGITDLRCEICGAAIADKVEKIAERMSSIIARYPDLAEKLVSSGALADWIALAAVLKDPVLTMFRHGSHVQADDDEHTPDDYSAYSPYQPRTVAA